MSRGKLILGAGASLVWVLITLAFSGAVNPVLADNPRPVRILSQLDIDADGASDLAPDSDGDGLPDNWEEGGQEAPSVQTGQAVERLVSFPAPTAIGPGTPPTFIFTRRAVTTRADNRDTDGDGLSDFVEVFGLKYIDDNGNGRLDFATDSAGGIASGSEWYDANGDGLPSVGEFPLSNTDPQLNRQNDFDGFVFTDPTNPDTDGDGMLDGDDPDPLINPRTFNVQDLNFFTRGSDLTDMDYDNDGLGNGSDFGNDLTGKVDQPADLTDLLKLFRSDLLELEPPVVPEAVTEDLLGADWDGNGLYRVTDVRDWTPVIGEAQLTKAAFPEFWVGDHKLFREQSFDTLQQTWTAQRSEPYRRRGLGLGYQLVLRPSGATNFLPDNRVWAILYAWRVPGFDINGNGFVGVPSAAQGTTAANATQPTNAAVALTGSDELTQEATYAEVGSPRTPFFAFDDRVVLNSTGAPKLNGQIETNLCGSIGSAAATIALGAFLVAMCTRPVRRARRSC